MRIRLQDTNTGLFYVRSNEWTKDPRRAFVFGSGDEVIKTAVENQITDSAVIFYEFDIPDFNFTTPVKPAVKPRAH